MVNVRVIARPSDTCPDTFARCVSHVRDPELRTRFQSVSEEVSLAGAEFERSVRDSSLHLFIKFSVTDDSVSSDELQSLYNRLSGTGYSVRSVYERLLLNSPHGKCPLCNLGEASTLDHHLPKTRHPILSVTPDNLVPACDACQRRKGSRFPDVAERQTLHPYFDTFHTERWLFARVERLSPPVVMFSIATPPDWTDLQKSRVEHHASMFNLCSRYSSIAAGELAGIRKRLVDLHRAEGDAGVHRHLRSEAESRLAVFANSWQGAMYEACAASEWYCHEGHGVT
jgi:hypothetical protein